MNSEERSTNGHSEKSWLGKLTQAFSGDPKNRTELLDLLRSVRDNDVIDSEAYGIIEGALAVSDKQVRDVMIPRSKMVIIQADAAPQEFLPQVVKSSHSRFPVVGESLDDIHGIIHAKDLLPLALADIKTDFDLTQIARSATMIPESKRLNVLLKEFREQRYHMAIVVDEYGGVSGLVTIEDVLEEIVGEIEDEHDSAQAEQRFIKKLTDDDFIVQALTPIEDFNEHFDVKLDDSEFDTIGGLLTQAFGHLPQRNETATIEAFNFRVLNADSRRIHLLRMTING